MSTPLAALLGRYQEVTALDFEFQAPPGERPWPVCMVAKELRSGRVIKLWHDELVQCQKPPFDIGPKAAISAHFASAELGCFKRLGWGKPFNVIDTFVEHRQLTNGRKLEHGNSLIGALMHRGLDHMGVVEKEGMRALIMERTSRIWTADEKHQIFNYCEADVLAVVRWLTDAAEEIDYPRAEWRGQHMVAVADMEWSGVPIDTDIHSRMMANWPALKAEMALAANKNFPGIYDGIRFRSAAFDAWLRQHQRPWPRLKDGAPKLDNTTFRDMSLLHPDMRLLHEIRTSLSQLRLAGLSIGCDGYNRTLVSPFKSTTARNQPSNSRSIFGPSAWMRFLIKPKLGHGLAYVDFCFQEIVIAAALSGDEAMIADCLTGDPYLAFGKRCGFLPDDATKKTHRVKREQFKRCLLGINYGMGAHSLAIYAGCGIAEAVEIIRHHRLRYRRYWRWVEDTIDAARLTGTLHTCFGWSRFVSGSYAPVDRDHPDDMRGDSPTSIQNWPCQANGAEMMRATCIAATRAGMDLWPVHDGFLLTARLENLRDRTEELRGYMWHAGEAVTGGLPVGVEVDKYVRWPDRFEDGRGLGMWQFVTDRLRAQEAGEPTHEFGSDRAA